MSSLHSLVLFPSAPAPPCWRPSLAQASTKERRLLFPIPVAKHGRLRATKIGSATAKDHEKASAGTALLGEEELLVGLQRDLMPKHVAVILDGNRRWAEKRGLLTSEGHKAGARRVVDHAKLCFKLGVETFSAFAFSTENWGRPKDEVNYLMDAFERCLKSEMTTFQREGIRISIIGNTRRIPKSLLRAKLEAEEATKEDSRKQVILAVDYSGRYDILQACKSIAQKAKDGVIQVEDVNENLMEQELLTRCTELPHPDLLIRTSGEQRVSNFYLWQLAYTELFFSPVLWPDFGEAEFIEALTSYQRRERRFGRRL